MQERRFVGFRGVGVSMQPSIEHGDLLVVDRQPGRLKRNDILAFGDVVHRLVWIDPAGGLWELGDNPGRTLPRRRKRRDVGGRVVAVAREGRWIDVPERPPSRMRVLTALVRCLSMKIAARVLSIGARRRAVI